MANGHDKPTARLSLRRLRAPPIEEMVVLTTNCNIYLLSACAIINVSSNNTACNGGGSDDFGVIKSHE